MKVNFAPIITDIWHQVENYLRKVNDTKELKKYVVNRLNDIFEEGFYINVKVTKVGQDVIIHILV